MTTMRNRQLLVQTLRRVTEMLAGDRDLERIHAAILDGALAVMGGEAAALVLPDGEEHVRIVRWRNQIGQGTELDRHPCHSSGLIHDIVTGGQRVATALTPLMARYDPEADSLPGLRPVNLVGLPFRTRGEAGGAILVWNALRLERDAGEELDILEILACQAAVAAENFRLYKRLEQLAITDELTQIYNYRFLKSALRKEVKRAQRSERIFTILMVDVDHLKKYNESFGHLSGSNLLRTVASLLYQNCRKGVDVVAKYGGDEFMIILPDTNTPGALAMANRVRVAVEREAFHHVTPGEITITVGVAAYPAHGRTVDELIASADDALYTAKRGGRNRVLVFEPPAGDLARTKPAA